MSVTDAAHPVLDDRMNRPGLAGAPVELHPSGVFYAPPASNRFTRSFSRMNARMPWAAPVAIATCFAGAASYVLVTNPTDAGANDISTCIVKLITGLDCPGCGGTRAFYYLMTGNVPQAARHHAVAVFAAPFLVWLYAAWAVKRVTGKQIPTPTIGPKVLGVFLGVWAVWMVLRNLPVAPFTAFYV
jgi:hypothetical protein